MKILLVAPQPFFEERGTPIAVRLLVEALCAMGHQTDLLVYGIGEDVIMDGLQLFRAGIPGITSVPIGISLRKIVLDIGLAIKMAALLRRARYDVVHAVEEAVFPAAFLQRFFRFRLVYDMDSSMADQLTEKWWLLKPLRRVFELVERAAVKRSTAVLAVCEDLAAKVRRWTPPEQVVVLPDVPMADGPADGGSTATHARIDPSEILRLIVPGDGLIALYVGNLERYQGIDLLLESIALVPADVAVDTVIIGGKDAHVRHYQARAAALGIAGRVHFLGPRPLQRLGRYLAQADILLSPRALGTNTPMKIYSYMQAGRVILATDIRSHTQALDATCAELAAPEPAALAAGLVRLAADPQRRERLGRAAHEKAEREYSMPVYLRKLREVYARLAR